MKKLGLRRDIDLALHLPLRYEDETRITPLANARDVGEWLGASAHGLFSFAPGVRPVPLEIHMHGLDIHNFEARMQVAEAQTGKPVLLHAGSVHWNKHRERWVMIAVQEGGGDSYLGEVWYAEARQIEGPWRKAVKIATHPKYSFYNPSHHAFFDQQEGRLIYFQGTYAETFSGNPIATPRYDYNQVMYRLDLDDERLKAARVD